MQKSLFWCVRNVRTKQIRHFSNSRTETIYKRPRTEINNDTYKSVMGYIYPETINCNIGRVIVAMLIDSRSWFLLKQTFQLMIIMV